MAMCEAKDFPPSERDELMGLVTQLQGQVAQLTAAKEELHKQVAELKRAESGPGNGSPQLFGHGVRKPLKFLCAVTMKNCLKP